MLDLRKNYIDFGEQLQPPRGFQIEYAVATTYTLDLYALLSIPLAMYYNQSLDSEVSEDNFQILEAIQNLQKHLKIYCQKGKIAIPKASSVSLLAFIETCVNEYTPDSPRQSFHPKVWVLRFKSLQTKDIVYRLIVMSRNLTFDKSYDIAYTMEGSPAGKSSEENKDLLVLMNQLYETSAFDHKEFISDLGRVKFVLCENFDSYNFSSLPGINSKDVLDIETVYQSRLVVSPFLSETTLGRVIKACQIPPVIFSRKNELDQLSDETFDKIEAYYFSQQIADHHLYENIDEGNEDDYNAFDWDNNLHAKLYMAWNGKETKWLLGSANCSEAAFSNNVEFLIHLNTGFPELNIEKIKKELLAQHNGVSVFQPYERTPEFVKALPEPDYREIEYALLKLLEDAQSFSARADFNRESKRYDLSIKAQLPDFFKSDEYILQCIPVGYQGPFQEIRESGTIEFPDIPLHRLSCFMHWQIKITGTDEILDLVTKIEVENMPSHRLNNILKTIIDNPDKFMVLLKALLSDEPIGKSEGYERAERGRQQSDEFSPLRIGIPIYEELLLNLSRSPERLQRLSALIEKLKEADDQQVIPVEFSQIWTTVEKFFK